MVQKLLNVYQSLVFPLITYCSLCLYGTTPPFLKERLKNMENSAERLVCCPLPKREDVLKKKMCTYVHKCLYKNDIPPDVENYFEFKLNKINIRSNGTMLKIPTIKLESTRASFKYQGVTLFNSLQRDQRSEVDFESFKKSLIFT